MPDDPDRHEPALSRALRERGDALRDPTEFERARAEALADETGYDVATALAVLRGMEPPPRRLAGHVEDVLDPRWLALPPEERAAALEAEAAKGTGIQRFEALVARVRASGEFVDLSRDVEPPPVRNAGAEDMVATVRLRADGELVVSAPGTPPTRIVAVRAKRARAAAQRVAELVEEALQARERRP
ncbi:hypothetical protein LRS73_04365 [Methylobacterium currus]|uniref:hypothetical protein n=1 Tax=Methylobacterium currus TaxID=2051553 RepID=UPI001E368E3E|nr:hypothetical protein [Methylobacterium currus]UHC17155.1 hypothetical protein LRS73_04365 [Methylobacterium currus]